VDHPFFLLLNLAVGGFWDGTPGGGTVFPAQMVVDRVTVGRMAGVEAGFPIDAAGESSDATSDSSDEQGNDR